MSGTTTLAAVNGVATFSGLSLDRTGSGYTLVASAAGLRAATSTAFNITVGPASRLAFTVPPSGATVGLAIIPAVQVAIADAGGNTVTTATNSVTFAIGTNPGGATLSGTLTVAAVSGVATFSGLSLNKPASGYTLVASAAGLTGATTATFAVTPFVVTINGATGLISFPNKYTGCSLGGSALTNWVAVPPGWTVGGSSGANWVAYPGSGVTTIQVRFNDASSRFSSCSRGVRPTRTPSSPTSSWRFGSTTRASGFPRPDRGESREHGRFAASGRV